MTNDHSSGGRHTGIEFGALDQRLENHDYPTSTAELLEAHGDVEVGLQNGTEPLSEILGLLGEETYRSADAVRRDVVTLVGDGAIGRKHYSDRSPARAETDLDRQQSSF